MYGSGGENEDDDLCNEKDVQGDEKDDQSDEKDDQGIDYFIGLN